MLYPSEALWSHITWDTICFSWIPPLHVWFKVFQGKSVLQTFSSWILGSFRKCHSVCLPHADKCHYSQQFPPSIIYITSNTWKYHLCSCLCCARHHLHLCPLCSSQHLLLCAAVTEWILWLQQEPPAAGQQPETDTSMIRFLSDGFVQAWLMLNWDYWDCITIGMISSRHDIFYCSWTPSRISPVSWLQSLAILTCNFASFSAFRKETVTL